MRNFKIILFAALAAVVIGLGGCESNDNPTKPIYNPSNPEKKVLLEFFTNAGCIPCIAAHNYLDGITALSGVTINDTNVIIISFHAKYPYNQDSIYRANIEQNDGRSTYYGVLFTPQGRLNGTSTGQFSASDWTAQFNAELQTDVIIDIGIERTFDPNTGSGTVTAFVHPLTTTGTTDNVIHFIITENNVPYVTAPNGITHPDDVMRFMITGTNGEAVSLTTGQTTEVTKSFTLNNSWNQDECYITAYVQSTSTGEVFGVNRIKVK
jgi:hypothetical protein